MIEKEAIEFDGKEYFVLMELTYQGKNYAYLANKKDVRDFLILQSLYEEKEEIFKTLDNEEEFDTLFSLFQKEAQKKIS